MKRSCLLLFLILGLVAVSFAGKKKNQDPEQFCDLKIKVFKLENGKPVRNASVVLHPVDEKGKQSRSGMDLKTDENGEAAFNGAPYGTMRVQVISPELQTYGDDIAINQPQQEIVVKMKPPQSQYSIYEHGATQAPNADTGEKKDDQKK